MNRRSNRIPTSNRTVLSKRNQDRATADRMARDYDRWGHPVINAGLLETYRFEPVDAARLKTLLDVLAVIYVVVVSAVLAANAHLLSITQSLSAFSVMHTVTDAFVLTPLLPAQYGLLFFLVLASAILLHQSYSLNHRIETFVWLYSSYYGHAAFLGGDGGRDGAAALAWWQRCINVISTSINAVVVSAAALYGIRLVWYLPQIPLLQTYRLVPGVIYASMLITVTGAYGVSEYLLREHRRPVTYVGQEPVIPQGLHRSKIEYVVAIIFSTGLIGLAFGADFALGLGENLLGGVTGTLLGVGLGLGASLCHATLLRDRYQDLPDAIERGIRKVVIHPLAVLSKPAVSVLEALIWLVNIPVNIMLIALCISLLLVWVVLIPVAGPIFYLRKRLYMAPKSSSISQFRYVYNARLGGYSQQFKDPPLSWGGFIFHIISALLKWQKESSLPVPLAVYPATSGLGTNTNRVYSSIVQAIRNSLLSNDGWFPRLINKAPVAAATPDVIYHYISEPELEPIFELGTYGENIREMNSDGTNGSEYTKIYHPKYAFVDPLDPSGHQAITDTRGVPWSKLYLHSAARILVVYVILYGIEFLLSFGFVQFSEKLLPRGDAIALSLGLICGFAFALISSLGRSSLSGLTTGFVSSLVLASLPPESLVSPFTLVHYGSVILVFAVVQITVASQGRRAIGIIGLIGLLAGIYLQAALTHPSGASSLLLHI